jgi:hypothetical protein
VTEQTKGPAGKSGWPLTFQAILPSNKEMNAGGDMVFADRLISGNYET